MALVLLTRAQAAHADPATAEALFSEGRRLLDQGRYEEACVKLGESQAQDPASGTLINLALCYEKQGKLATAWAQYRSAATLARQDARPDRVATAEQKIAELDHRVPRLVLRTPHALPGMLASWGAVRIAAGAFGSPIPTDPGTYSIDVRASGFKPWTTTITVSEGETRIVDIPVLEAEHPEVSTVAAVPGKAAQRVVARAPAPAKTTAKRDGSSIPPLILGGSGLVGLGLGAFFGITALSKYATAEGQCPTHHGCSSEAVRTRDDAETRAWAANISVGAGLVATGVAAWLWFRPSSGSKAAVRVRFVPLARGGQIAVHASL